ncbi:uncharacterized protein LOC119093414 [Pollicipes pollicipes]|uniref:uncharacterized protein LOC119093414 n=1 Tax=Pollicipes pollicipes TaxID=41117 RepID=UPI001884BDF7|nr:uncharacterized protein LOC119093414 [Pollicipes pollicipes]
MSDRIQKKAITAALVGGLLLLIVSIILSVCTVKICNKRKRRKQEKEYNMVACRVTEARNGLHSPVPLKKYVRRVPRLIRHASQLLWRPRPSTGLSQSLIDDLDLTPRRAKTVYSVEMEYSQPLAWITRTPDGRFVVNGDDDGGFLTDSGERRRRRQLQSRPQPLRTGIYHVERGRRSPEPTPVPAGRRVSHGFGRHQIPEQAPAVSPHVALSPDGRRFRASSPGPLGGQLGPFDFSDLSSVQVPGSVGANVPQHSAVVACRSCRRPASRERQAGPQETPRAGTHLPAYLPPPAYLAPPQPLDISVDDHYEFDPVLTPGTESPGGAPPLTRSRPRPVPEMEARVQAMRQEFQQYRQRRARRHRSGDEPITETVC